MYRTCPVYKENISLPFIFIPSLGRSDKCKPVRRISGGQMRYSKKPKIADFLFEYSGYFLTTNRLVWACNCWYHPSLYYACEWLQNNNPYLVAYHSLASCLLEQSELSSVNLSAVWPQAMHIPEDNIAPLLIRQIY